MIRGAGRGSGTAPRLPLLALLISLAAPYLQAALTPLASSLADSCGMSCCKRTRSCCCGKARKHGQGVQAEPQPECPPRCRTQRSLSPVPQTLAEPPIERAFAAGAPVSPLAAVDADPRPAAPAAFELFQRPPPGAR